MREYSVQGEGVVKIKGFSLTCRIEVPPQVADHVTALATKPHWANVMHDYLGPWYP